MNVRRPQPIVVWVSVEFPTDDGTGVQRGILSAVAGVYAMVNRTYRASDNCLLCNYARTGYGLGAEVARFDTETLIQVRDARIMQASLQFA